MPEPVCQTLSGKLSSNFPDITSCEALIIELAIFALISLSFLCTIAADFLIIAIDFININLTFILPISKNFLDLSVEAPQYLSPGTLIIPILSFSFLFFMI